MCSPDARTWDLLGHNRSGQLMRWISGPAGLQLGEDVRVTLDKENNPGAICFGHCLLTSFLTLFQAAAHLPDLQLFPGVRVCLRKGWPWRQLLLTLSTYFISHELRATH